MVEEPRYETAGRGHHFRCHSYEQTFVLDRGHDTLA